MSAILYIEGIGIKDATLYFENKALRTIPLTGEDRSSVGKAGQNFAAIVVDTTRGTPGWQDIDLRSIMTALREKDYPKADGVFYVVVRDGFGRGIRFDIEYEKWQIVRQQVPACTFEGIYEGFTKTMPDAPGGFKYTSKFLEARNRWWDPNSSGTSITKGGAWTYNTNVEPDGATCVAF